MLKKIVPVLFEIVIVFLMTTGVASAETRYLNTAWDSVNDNYYLPMDYANQLIKAENCNGCPEIKEYAFYASNTNRSNKPAITLNTANGYLEKDSATSNYSIFDENGIIFNIGENSAGYPENPKITLFNIAWYNAAEKKWGLYDLDVSLYSFSYSPEYTSKDSRKAYERKYHLLYIGKTKPFPRIIIYGCKRVTMHFTFKVSANTAKINASNPGLLSTSLPKTNITYEDLDMQQRVGACSSVAVPTLKKHKNIDSGIKAFAKGEKICYEENEGTRYLFSNIKQLADTGDPDYTMGFGVSSPSGGFYMQFYSSMAKNYDVRSGAYSSFYNTGTSMFAKEPNSIYERVNEKLSDTGEEFNKEIKYTTYDVIGNGYTRTVNSKKYTNPSIITKTEMSSSLPKCLRKISMQTSGADGITNYDHAPEYTSQRTPGENSLHKFEMKVNQNYYEELKKIAGYGDGKDFITPSDWAKAYNQTNERGDFSVDSDIMASNATITHRTFLNVDTKTYSNWQNCDDKTRYASNNTTYTVPFPWKNAGVILKQEKYYRGQKMNFEGIVEAHTSTKIDKIEVYPYEYRNNPEKWAIITDASDVENEGNGYQKYSFSSASEYCKQETTLDEGLTEGEHPVEMKITFSNIPYSKDQPYTTITVPANSITVVDKAAYEYITVPEEVKKGESFFAAGTIKCNKEAVLERAEFYVDHNTFNLLDGEIKTETFVPDDPLLKGTSENNTISTNEFRILGTPKEDSRYITRRCRVIVPTDKKIPRGNHYVYMMVYYKNNKKPSVCRTGILVEENEYKTDKEISEIHYTSKPYQKLVTTKDYQELLSRTLSEDTSEIMKRISEKIFGD